MVEILNGIRVLDFSRYVSGPQCGQILADMGADVIKVEKCNGGDETRTLGPWKDDTSLYYPAHNRNKRSIALDFRSDEGKHVIRELAKTADVIIENFRVGTAKKMGIDYESLKDINPRIIVASISGFGQEGPYSKRAAFDSIVTFMGGISWIHPQLNAPVNGRGPLTDILASLYASIGILSALHYREKTGKGQALDIPMLACAVSTKGAALAAYMTNDFKEPQVGVPDSAPQGPCRTGDGWISIHAGTGPMWARLKEIIKTPELHDPKYDDVQQRVQDRVYLMSLVEQWAADKTSDEVERIFAAAGIPVGVLGTSERLYHHAQLRDQGDIVDVDVPGIGKLPFVGFPVKFSACENTGENWSATLGQHNQEILDELGL